MPTSGIVEWQTPELLPGCEQSGIGGRLGLPQRESVYSQKMCVGKGYRGGSNLHPLRSVIPEMEEGLEREL